MRHIIFFLFLSKVQCTFYNYSSFYEELFEGIEGKFTLVSCNHDSLRNNLLKNLGIKQTFQLIINPNDITKTIIKHDNVLWDHASCHTENNFIVSSKIENSPISKLWIVLHDDNSTIFATKLHQNIIHFNKQTETSQ